MLREVRSLSRRADKLSSAAAVVDDPTTQHLVAEARASIEQLDPLVRRCRPPAVAVPQRRLHPRFKLPTSDRAAVASCCASSAAVGGGSGAPRGLEARAPTGSCVPGHAAD